MTTAKLDSSAKGVFAISATPFTDSGDLDLASVGSLVDFYLRFGVDGLTILGVMGEAPKLSGEESLTFVRSILHAVAGRVPVVVGASNPGTRTLAEFSHAVMELGAAGVMIAPISGLRTEEQIHGYLTGVMQALGPDVPVVLQDYPPSTGVFMSSASIERAIDEFPQIVMLKHEDWPGLGKLSRLANPAPGRRKVSIVIGSGALHLPQELARGAVGAMTGFSYPEVLVETCRLFAEGQPDAGEDLFDLYLPLIRHEYQVGIGLAIRKEILRRRGAIASAYVRVPGPKLTAADHAEIDRLVTRLERKLAARR